MATITLLPKENGGTLLEPSGEATLLLQPASSEALEAIKIRDGRWVGLLPDDTYLPTALAGEACVYAISCGTLLSPETPTLVVDFWAPSEWRLEVIDEVSRLAVSQVTLVTTDPSIGSPLRSMFESPPRPPEDAVVLAKGQPSPVVLHEGGTRGSVYWAGAPGYAWRVFVRSAFQKDVSVALTPVGAVDVRTSNPSGENDEPVEVVVSRDTEFQQVLVVSPGSQVRFEDVPQGRTDVVLRRPSPVEHGAVLATREVLVERGQTSNVDLVVPASRAGGDLRLTLVLPAAGSQGVPWSVMLLSGLRDDWRAISEESISGWTPRLPDRVFERLYSNLEPEEYLVRVYPVGWEERVLVTEGGQDVVIEIPQIAQSRITCDSSRGKGWSELCWRYAGSVGAQEGRCFFERPMPDGSFMVTSLFEAIDLRVVMVERASEWVRVEPRADGGTVHVPLSDEQACALVLELWKQGSRVPVEGGWERVEVVPEDHDGRMLTWLSGFDIGSIRVGDVTVADSSRAAFLFTGPGRYLVQFYDRPRCAGPRALRRQVSVDVPRGVTTRRLSVE